MKGTALKMNLHVDNINTGALGGVVVERVKRSVAHRNVFERRECEAAPVVFGVVRNPALAAVASKLKEQSLLCSVLGADCVRTHLADESVVVSDDLLLVQDRVSYRVVCGAWHIGVGERRVA